MTPVVTSLLFIKTMSHCINTRRSRKEGWSMKILEKISRSALWLVPIVIVGGSVALLWVKQRNPGAASVLGPVVAISLMAYTTFMTSRQQRRLDEVQIASQGFANGHGLVYGASVTVLLLMLPPVQN